MARSLRHRGPDDSGTFHDRNVALAHTRLSIQDLSSAGHQPMTSSCGRFVVAFNGEIYNFPELREELGEIAWRGHSDTEVILEMFARDGIAVLSKLNGMFALSLYDRTERRLWLARDRFGIKPLYVSKSEQGLWFGSEIKALFAGGYSERLLDRSKLHEYLYYGVSLGSGSLWKNIRQVQPGEFECINTRTLEVDTAKFFDFSQIETIDMHPAEAAAHVQDLLRQSVRRHLISDVPVGVFLSGGIDSSAITAFAAENHAGPISTYSVGFDSANGIDELPVARSLAEAMGTDHNELHVTIRDVRSTLESLCASHDLPFSDAANIPLYLLCRQLDGKAKVVLQGDGGDEIFGGYNRYRWLTKTKLLSILSSLESPLRLRRLLGGRAQSAGRILDCFAESRAVRMALLLTEESRDPSPTRVLSAEMRDLAAECDPFKRYRDVDASLSTNCVVQRMLLTDCQVILPDVFLPKVDRSTMAHSIEVRVPFLDAKLTEFVMSLKAGTKLPRGEQKGLLKAALQGVVPDSILDGKKTGFSVPYKDWMRGDLGDWLTELLQEARTKEVLDANVVMAMLAEHRAGRGRVGFLLYKTLILAAWLAHYRVTV